MYLMSYYVRNKDEVKFTAAFLGMMLAGVVLSDMLTRAISGSPLRRTVYNVVSPLGLNAAAPSALLFGMYLTALALLGLDETKRPQSMVLAALTVVGMIPLALNGQFLVHLGIAELAVLLLGVVAAVLYVGIDELQEVSVVDGNGGSGSSVERRGSTRLEFRSAERLLYSLLAFVVIVSLFEAYTNYPPLLDSELYLNAGAFTEFRFVEPSGGQLAVEVAAIAVALLTSYVFLGYDAKKTFFIAGPKRSGKTHAAIALHQEAVTHGYEPRGEASDLLEMESKLLERNTNWLETTDADSSKDLSFSFTSKGLFRKNIRLEAIDYAGELLRAITAVRRYYAEPERELTAEYAGAATREQWLEMKTSEAREKDFYSGSMPNANDSSPAGEGDEGSPISDGGVSDESSPDDDPFSSERSAADDEREEESASRRARPASGHEGTLSKGTRTVKDVVWPAFERADTLLLVVDMKRYLRDEPLEADALYNLYDKSNKDAIVIATKCDLLAEEFAESHGWKTAWAREPYDEFRTHVRGILSEHNMLSHLFDKIERPYPVGYQTIPLKHVEEQYERIPDTRTDIGNKRVEVHGYEYVLERIS
jgi:hypothetical protein